MKKTSGMLFLAIVAPAGCTESGPPDADSVAPEVRLIAQSPVAGGGTRVFSSDEGADAPVDACAKFLSHPSRWHLTVSDAGGVRSARLSTSQGRIVPGSVSTVPGAPEATVQVRSLDEEHDEIQVDLVPPADGEVRTGLLVVFDVEPLTGSPPEEAVYALNASGSDYSRNRTFLYQVDGRVSDDSVVCRGE